MTAHCVAEYIHQHGLLYYGGVPTNHGLGGILYTKCKYSGPQVVSLEMSVVPLSSRWDICFCCQHCHLNFYHFVNQNVSV